MSRIRLIAFCCFLAAAGMAVVYVATVAADTRNVFGGIIGIVAIAWGMAAVLASVEVVFSLGFLFFSLTILWHPAGFLAKNFDEIWIMVIFAYYLLFIAWEVRHAIVSESVSSTRRAIGIALSLVLSAFAFMLMLPIGCETAGNSAIVAVPGMLVAVFSVLTAFNRLSIPPAAVGFLLLVLCVIGPAAGFVPIVYGKNMLAVSLLSLACAGCAWLLDSLEED